MRLGRVLWLFIWFMMFASLGYWMHVYIGRRMRFCSFLTHPAVAVGFMMFVGWLVFLGFFKQMKKP